MEGIYRHRETGAEQIFSDATVSLLGGSKVWEFMEEFNPNAGLEVASIDTTDYTQTGSTIATGAETQRVRDVNPDDDEPEDDEEQEQPKQILPLPSPKPALAKPSAPKPAETVAKPKAIDLKDLNE